MIPHPQSFANRRGILAPYAACEMNHHIACIRLAKAVRNCALIKLACELAAARAAMKARAA